MIFYHVPHARREAPTELTAGMEFNFLHTYPLNVATLRARYPGKKLRLLLDSGAFVAFNAGTAVDVEKYIDYCHMVKADVEAYASLDVINNPRLSAKNLRRMESAGLSPIPTHHMRSPKEGLIELMENYSYIGIGGVEARNPRVLAELGELISAHDTKVHLWGRTEPAVVYRLPVYSVDSSTLLRVTTLQRRNQLSKKNRRLRVQTINNFNSREGVLRRDARYIETFVALLKRHQIFEASVNAYWARKHFG